MEKKRIAIAAGVIVMAAGATTAHADSKTFCQMVSVNSANAYADRVYDHRQTHRPSGQGPIGAQVMQLAYDQAYQRSTSADDARQIGYRTCIYALDGTR